MQSHNNPVSSESTQDQFSYATKIILRRLKLMLKNVKRRDRLMSLMIVTISGSI